MTTFTEYWHGRTKAVISQQQFSSEMINLLYRQPASPTLFCNQVFELFYNARNSIGLCRDVDQKQRMTDSLESAATEGSGRGVSDLEEAFNHLAATGGSWIDENTDQYSGGRNKFYPTNVSGPESIVNFANAVDDASAELLDVVEQFTEVQLTVADELRQAGGGRSSNWSRIGDAASAVSTWSDRVGHLLWVADAPSTTRSRVATVGTFASHASSLHGALTTAAHMRSWRVRADERLANSLTVLQIVSDQLPILGAIYSKAIEMVPEIVANYRHQIEQRQRRADDAVRQFPYIPRGLPER